MDQSPFESQMRAYIADKHQAGIECRVTGCEHCYDESGKLRPGILPHDPKVSLKSHPHPWVAYFFG